MQSSGAGPRGRAGGGVLVRAQVWSASCTENRVQRGHLEAGVHPDAGTTLK